MLIQIFSRHFSVTLLPQLSMCLKSQIQFVSIHTFQILPPSFSFSKKALRLEVIAIDILLFHAAEGKRISFASNLFQKASPNIIGTYC